MQVTNVLILCTHNSARSVLGEGMLNHLAAGRGASVRGYSAGSQPGGKVNPLALDVLARAGINTTSFRSKSWDEFTLPDSPGIDIVITVCDSAAAEACPVFFARTADAPVRTHWGYPDPSNAEGGETARRRAFELTRQALGFRMGQLLDIVTNPAFDSWRKTTTGRQRIKDALDMIARS